MRTVKTLIAALLCSACTLAWGQPVTRIVVPFAAGGVQDIVARSFNAELGAVLGRSVIVENRAGAGGTIGTGYVAKAAPDGQTLILAAASHTPAVSGLRCGGRCPPRGRRCRDRSTR